MSTKMPPVPPANRSPKAGTDEKSEADSTRREILAAKGEQKRQEANIKQNTTHQGYQQDR